MESTKKPKLTYRQSLERSFRRVPVFCIKYSKFVTRKRFIDPDGWGNDIPHITRLYNEPTGGVSALQLVSYLDDRLTIIDSKFSALLSLDSIFLVIFAFSAREDYLNYYDNCIFAIRVLIQFTYVLSCVIFVASNFLSLWWAGERYYAKFYFMRQGEAVILAGELSDCMKDYSALTYKRTTFLHLALFYTVIATASVLAVLIISRYPILGIHSHLLSAVGACRSGSSAATR